MKINKTNEYIEIIGHYDNEVQCAKMTLLAELYAIEHHDGYAKFPLNVEDKLGLVDNKLEFFEVMNDYKYQEGNNVEIECFVASGIIVTLINVARTTGDDDIVRYNLLTGMLEETLTFHKDGNVVDLSTLTENKTYKLNSDGSYEEVVPTPQITCDLTTLQGWSSLSDGEHSITIKAKATGYCDSVASEAVTVTKGSSGFTVSGTYDYGTINKNSYSLDNGQTWNDLGDEYGSGTFTIENVTQIKFKCTSTGFGPYVKSTKLSLNINAQGAESENFTLTQDIDDVQSYVSGIE